MGEGTFKTSQIDMYDCHNRSLVCFSLIARFCCFFRFATSETQLKSLILNRLVNTERCLHEDR